MVKKILATFLFSYSALIAFTQRGYDDDSDADDIKSWERYAHVGLTKVEIGAIVVGIILIIVSQSINNNRLGKILMWVGFFFCIPLLMVILAVASKVIQYAIMLTIILGVLYFILSLFEKKN